MKINQNQQFAYLENRSSLKKIERKSEILQAIELLGEGETLEEVAVCTGINFNLLRDLQACLIIGAF